MNSNAIARACQNLPYIKFSLGPVCFDNLSRLNLHLLCGNFELKLNDFRRSKSEEINIRENYLVNFLTFKSLENAIFQSWNVVGDSIFSHLMIWIEIYRYFIVIFCKYVLKIMFLVLTLFWNKSSFGRRYKTFWSSKLVPPHSQIRGESWRI